MSLKHIKKGFTLIEMLIVVVIIGILAAALIPRLQSVQSRARDTKRKADLAQIGGGLSVYKSDNGSFAAFSGKANVGSTATVGDIAYTLVNSNYLTSVPTDSATVTSTIGSTANSSATYAYVPLKTTAGNDGGFVLGAKTETAGSSSNFVKSTINTFATQELITTAQSRLATGTIVQTTLLNATGSSFAGANGDELRYVYIQ